MSNKEQKRCLYNIEPCICGGKLLVKMIKVINVSFVSKHHLSVDLINFFINIYNELLMESLEET